MASCIEDEEVDSGTVTRCRFGASSLNVATDGGMEGKQGRKRLCPHCSDIVSRATYFRHKRVFYDYETKQWNMSRSSTASNTGEVGGVD